jgi:hypothetical protein
MCPLQLIATRLSQRRRCRTRINQPPKLLQGVRPRRLEAHAFALYRDCAPQLLVKEFLAVAKVANLRADGVDDVLDGLRVLELTRDFALLRMRVSVGRNAVRGVRPLHACDCAQTSGAGWVDDAWHRLRQLVVARRVAWRRICARRGVVERRQVRDCGGEDTCSGCRIMSLRWSLSAGSPALAALSLSLACSGCHGGRSLPQALGPLLAWPKRERQITPLHRPSTSVHPPTTFTSSRSPHPYPQPLQSPNTDFTMAVKPITGVREAIACSGQSQREANDRGTDAPPTSRP